MCYKSAEDRREMEEAEGLAAYWREMDRMGYKPKGDNSSWAFDHGYSPVMTSEEPGIVKPMRWGLIPHWIKTEHEGHEIWNKTLNARAETIFKLPSFRSIYKKRCLIYATAFYENQKVSAKKKREYIIKVKDAKYFTFGGVYDEWVNPDTGEIYKGYSIITVEANELMAEIHNTKKRMPLIIEPEAREKWLQPILTKEQIGELITRIPSERLIATPVEPDLESTLF